MAEAIEVVHLTDAHLFANEAGELKSMRTWQSFRAVLALAKKRHPRPDLLLLGGDMAQDEQRATYARLAEELAGWAEEVRITPGNHADLAALAAALLPALRIPALHAASCEREDWLVLPLCSHEPAFSPGGWLGEARLCAMMRALRQSHAEHVLIALHHHPCAIGTPWLDAMRLADEAAFWRIVKADGRVRAILFGHVHHELDSELDGIRLLGTPSSCIQFLPGSETIAFDRAMPGYRWLRLLPNGAIESGVERLRDFPLPDLSDVSPY